jgi:serine/threonine protein kinase
VQPHESDMHSLTVKKRNVCKLVEAIGYERKTPFGHTECDEVILVLSPFAPPLINHVGRHDQEWIVCIVRQLFAGLAHIHSRGFMHRDNKLDNIGIVESKPPRAVILDFGHASPKSRE